MEKLREEKLYKLSNDLKSWRAERPDEWTMDRFIRMAKDLENPPKHETVEQWEERTGDTYPDDGPVWVWSPCSDEWQMYESCLVQDSNRYIANHHGKPDSIGGR